MAIHLEIEYGGVIVASVPVELSIQGSLVRVLISAETFFSQVSSVWQPPNPGDIGYGTSSINGEVDQTLKVILRADSALELDSDDFVVLRSATALWLYVEGDTTALTISDAEFEIPEPVLFISFAEFEAPEPLIMLVSHAELEIPDSGLFVAYAELEIPTEQNIEAQRSAEVQYQSFSRRGPGSNRFRKPRF